MDKYLVLYNPQAGAGTGEKEARKLTRIMDDAELEFVNMTAIYDYEYFFSDIYADIPVIICGGDGTLNRFLNDIRYLEIKNSIWYYATGSGNDFLRDLDMEKGAKPVCIDRYIKNLPRVTVNGQERLFLNGVGYGIDGYCCEEGDRQRLLYPEKPVNYTEIAVKGLLFHYRPVNARITVDGRTQNLKRVWLAPAMNGRFYGGGMMAAPDQDRLDAEGRISLMVIHGSRKLKTLVVFPSIFKGKHVKHAKMVEILKGHDIIVEFDRPVALQIDGETVLNVTRYEAVSGMRTAGEAIAAYPRAV